MQEEGDVVVRSKSRTLVPLVAIVAFFFAAIIVKRLLWH
jgi:hypothetical protein